MEEVVGLGIRERVNRGERVGEVKEGRELVEFEGVVNGVEVLEEEV